MRQTSISIIDSLYLGHITPAEFLQPINDFEDWLKRNCTTKDDCLCILQAFEHAELPEHCEQIRNVLNNL